jgi:hypothetical protein
VRSQVELAAATLNRKAIHLAKKVKNCLFSISYQKTRNVYYGIFF